MEEQITYSQKFALLTADKYTELNQKISDAFGLPDGKGTDIYTTTTPELDVNGMSVIVITGEVQERFPELLDEIELVDSYEQETTKENDN